MLVRCSRTSLAGLNSFGVPKYLLAKEYAELTTGQEYLAMGIILGEGQNMYLIDVDDIPSLYPAILFEDTLVSIPSHWYYRTILISHQIFPYIQAIWGYYELCSDISHYSKLIDRHEQALHTYSRRKNEHKQLINKNNEG